MSKNTNQNSKEYSYRVYREKKHLVLEIHPIVDGRIKNEVIPKIKMPLDASADLIRFTFEAKVKELAK